MYVVGGIELTVGSQPKGFGVVKRGKTHLVGRTQRLRVLLVVRERRYILVTEYTSSRKGVCGFCLIVSSKGLFEVFGNWVYNFGVSFLNFLFFRTVFESSRAKLILAL